MLSLFPFQNDQDLLITAYLAVPPLYCRFDLRRCNGQHQRAAPQPTGQGSSDWDNAHAAKEHH